MNNRAALAVQIIATGLILGVLGDALLRVGPWGLNGLLWTFFLVIATVVLAARNHLALDGRALWLIFPVMGLAAGFVWRDSEALKALDFLAICAVLALSSGQARGARLAAVGIAEAVWRLIIAGLNAAAGYIPLFLKRTDWPEHPTTGWARQARAVAVGTLLALPLVMVFGALFMSADAVFNHWVHRIVRFDLAKLVSHLIPTAVCAWIVGGFLQGLLFFERDADHPRPLRQFWSLGPVEIGVAFGLLNLLFLGFILVQARYLFGGANMIEITPGLTYAEYARRGFFELVAVATLALPVLLAADWLLGASSRRLFRLQSASMVLMLFAILASAFHRMQLYQAEFGWTQLRFYVDAFMAWLAFILLWVAATVLTGRRERFVIGVAVSGLLMLLALHVANPDAWIARNNLAHARAGHTFDAKYAATLSADAAPVLAVALPDLNPAAREVLAKRLKRWSDGSRADWRLWSWSRAQARRAVEAQAREGEKVAATRPGSISFFRIGGLRHRIQHPYPKMTRLMFSGSPQATCVIMSPLSNLTSVFR